MYLERTNDRELPADWVGDVCVWDIDKTYLDTRFSSVRGLLGIPFELAVDKRAVHGTVSLLRGLRHGPRDDSALTPLYFISGSPTQMRKVVERKMTMDGVQFDGITFKDQWALLKAGRPKGITEQVGYKLQALLMYRREHPPGARYLLFGDDVERDLESFLLFGEVCAGLRGPKLLDRLRDMGVHKGDAIAATSLADALPRESDPVAHVFIHEVRGHRIHSTDPRVHAARDFADHARTLLALGKLRDSDVAAVLAEPT
ncbi:MAG TPA: hypothetical protein VGO62_10665 [Myxococcota bacterium]